MGFTIPSLVLLAVMTMVSSPGVAVPRPLNVMARVLGSVYSYRTIVVTGSTGFAAVGATSARLETVWVRQGARIATYTTSTYTIRGRTNVFEHVTTGTRLCTRSTGQRGWRCATIPVAARNTAQNAATLGALTRQARWTPIRDRRIGTELCMGYRVNNTSRSTATTTSSGILWIARRTKLPVELTATTSVHLTPRSKPLVTTLTVTWDRWNGKSLRIPRV